jgi:hypothetical protein
MNPGDRRSFLIHITEAGRELAELSRFHLRRAGRLPEPPAQQLPRVNQWSAIMGERFPAVRQLRRVSSQPLPAVREIRRVSGQPLRAFGQLQRAFGQSSRAVRRSLPPSG